MADLIVAVWDDGVPGGYHQARCTSCSWVGPWRSKKARAVQDAKDHRHEN